MTPLPRFHPNRVRPDEAPELVASRNFDALSSVMGKAFGAIEGDSSAMAKLLVRKANSTNPVIRGLLTLLGGVADLSQLSVTGNVTLTSANGTILADATGGSLTINLPAAATSKGLRFQIYKVDASANTVTIDANAAETIGGALTIVLGGNVGNSRLLIFCDGSNWQIRELYEEGTYTATLTGCTTSPTATVTYVRNGKSVDVRFAGLTATSNTTACTITGMPSHLFPAATQNNIPIGSVIDNTLDHIGLVTISTAGVFTLGIYTTSTNFTTTFTNVGAKGLSGFVLSYSQV